MCAISHLSIKSIIHIFIHTQLGHEIVVQVVYMIWNGYASFINMELQLQELSVPPRISVQKKLLSAFGINSKGCDSKELHKACAAMARIAAEKKKGTTTSMKLKAKGKEKEKAKGKRKKRGKCTASNEQEEEDEEDEDVIMDGDDMPWVDSNKEDGSNSNNEAKEEQARIQHEQTMEKHHTLIARHEEWKEMHTLLVGSKLDGCKKNVPVLNFARSPPSFRHTWKKLSCLSKDCMTVLMCGLTLINMRTWEWKNIALQSFTHVMWTFAAAMIAEASTIISYRHEMIFCHPHGGAASLCICTQNTITTCLSLKDPRQTAELCQTMLNNLLGSASQGLKAGQGSMLTKGGLPSKGCIMWLDSIYITTHDGGVAIHITEDELAHLERERDLRAQQHAIQKVIDAIQNLCITWHNPTSKVHTRDNPPLNADIALALQALVKVSANPHPLCS